MGTGLTKAEERYSFAFRKLRELEERVRKLEAEREAATYLQSKRPTQ